MNVIVCRAIVTIVDAHDCLIEALKRFVVFRTLMLKEAVFPGGKLGWEIGWQFGMTIFQDCFVTIAALL